MIGYRCALAGATVVLHERFDAEAVGRDLDTHRVTHISLVPPMLDRLLAVKKGPPRWLRVLLVGGQALDGTLARRAIDAGWPLHVTYGMTESASQIATSTRLAAAPATGVVGPMLPGIELRCDGTAESPAPIRIRGAVVMAGYANPLRLPGVGLEEGWYSSSDLGYLTPSGDLAILGRADEVLVIGGEAVLPSRVEDRLRSAPGVDSAVIVGLPDPVWGHRLVAVYAGRIDPAGLDAWAREHLGSRERPREFRRLGRLPALESGKTDRRGVRRLVAHASTGP
jgi:O-succinylbenzoic acid--CoA ligase